MSDVSSTGPSTPALRPTRPARSTERLTIHTSSSTPALTLDSDLDTPSTTDPLQTPTTPTRAHRNSSNRKSIGNVRRKPVPLTPDDFELELSQLQSSPDGTPPSPSPATSAPPISFRPPTYPYQQSIASSTRSHVLLPDPPLYVSEDPFQTPRMEYTSRSNLPDMDQAVMERSSTGEDLPTYEVETKMEPATLARGLWRVGWILPILWIIGMCILWIPLKPLEEETDPEKAQKLSEMIAILRETELKYAKRCMWGVVGWGVIIALIVLICVLVKHLS